MEKTAILKTLDEIRTECKSHVTLTQEAARRFFKTAAGSYSEHDAFLGITVPNLRKIAKRHQNAELSIIQTLLESKYNEERLLALYILVHQYQKSGTIDKENLCKFYLQNLKYVNNWNLVDSSAYYILGHYLWDKDRSFLEELAKSDIIWERRVAIVSTWYFIRQGEIDTTFSLAKQLLDDKHDLIHKAVGWMLREAGKKDQQRLIKFLKEYKASMPKTMLRYAMEKLTAEQKINILSPSHNTQ